MGTAGRKCASRKDLPEKACRVCTALFKPQRRWQDFCSPECRDKHHEHPWGHAKQKPKETTEEFQERLGNYRRKKLNNYSQKHEASGICRVCTKNVVPGTKSWCEQHWFAQAAWRNNLRGEGSWKRVKELLEKQNYKCPYTGRELILGVNASIDHKNPRGRFPDQANLWENVEWVDLEVNRAKRLMTKSEFIALCHVIASKNPATLSRHPEEPSPAAAEEGSFVIS